MNPKQLIPFLPGFKSYRDELSANLKICSKSEKEEIKNMIATIEVVLDYYKENYKDTLATIERLLSCGEITFDLLFTIFLPGTIVVVKDWLSTGELEAYRMFPSTLPIGREVYSYSMRLESIGVDDATCSRFRSYRDHGFISYFQGTMKISNLYIYPIQYHPHQIEVRQKLIERGKKWASLAIGIHHMHYEGKAAFGWSGLDETYRVSLYSLSTPMLYFHHFLQVNSRVILDRGEQIQDLQSYSINEDGNNQYSSLSKEYELVTAVRPLGER